VDEERRYAQELNALVGEAQNLFKTFAVEKAQEQILNLMPGYPTYQRQFERQTEGQHAATVLEAKLSHDLAYYRYFDQIIALADQAIDLKQLIDDLKKLPLDTRQSGLQGYLEQLKNRYTRSTS
jgi:bacterioferritin (cytochrome b1)